MTCLMRYNIGDGSGIVELQFMRGAAHGFCCTTLPQSWCRGYVIDMIGTIRSQNIALYSVYQISCNRPY
jgi:hypothetical protein